MPELQEPAGTALSGPDDDQGTPARRQRSGVLLWCLVVAGVALVLDQGSKLWALHALDDGRTIALVGDALRLRLVFNPGAAFSIGQSMTWVMTLVSLAVTIAIATLVRRLGSRSWAVALGLLLGGSTGNLIDRFFRDPGPLRGHVVDFIDYGDLFVGNVADIAIVGAAGLLLRLVLTNTRIDGQEEHHG